MLAANEVNVMPTFKRTRFFAASAQTKFQVACRASVVMEVVTHHSCSRPCDGNLTEALPKLQESLPKPYEVQSPLSFDSRIQTQDPPPAAYQVANPHVLTKKPV